MPRIAATSSSSVRAARFAGAFRAGSCVRADLSWSSYVAAFQQALPAAGEPFARVPNSLVEFALQQFLGQHFGTAANLFGAEGV
jgi:hypothetical protein